eukprot:1157399-Pelagomonas_calceolata.AAC.1
MHAWGRQLLGQSSSRCSQASTHGGHAGGYILAGPTQTACGSVSAGVLHPFKRCYWFGLEGSCLPSHSKRIPSIHPSQDTLSYGTEGQSPESQGVLKFEALEVRAPTSLTSHALGHALTPTHGTTNPAPLNNGRALPQPRYHVESILQQGVVVAGISTCTTPCCLLL